MDKSKCCGVGIRITTPYDEDKSKNFYCLKCGKPCDTIEQPEQNDWIENKMKEFEEMTPEEVGNGKLYGEKSVEEWLELNSEKHLYEDMVYSEPMLTLDIDKVKDFLKSSLTQQKEAIEKMKIDKVGKKD